MYLLGKIILLLLILVPFAFLCYVLRSKLILYMREYSDAVSEKKRLEEEERQRKEAFMKAYDEHRRGGINYFE